MNIERWLAPGLVAGALWAAPAAAQPAPTPGPTLAQAVEAAWQRAVQARESLGHERQARAEQAAASRWTPAAPAVELSHRDDRFHRATGNRETELGLAVPLWLPGQRSARLAAAEAQAAAAEAATRSARLKLAGEVRTAAWALVAQQAVLQLAEAQQAGLRQLADDVDRRVAAGDLARSDALAARSELLVADGALAQARQDLAAAQAQWTQLTGLPPLEDPGEPGGLDAADTHPELLRASLEVESARRQHEALRRMRRDAPELKLSVRQETPASGQMRERSLGIGLRLPLGAPPRALTEEAAALSGREVAEAELQRLRERLKIDEQTARAGVESARQQLAAAQARASLLRERARLLDTSFRAGETALPELLRALTAAAEADAAATRQSAALGLAQARLHQTLGLMP